MSKLEIFLRAALSIVTLLAVTVGLNEWILSVLFLVDAAATAELGIRPYGRNLIERVLLGCGALVTSLILIGLCLNFAPSGLTRDTWAIAWAIACIAVLIWRRNLGTDIQFDAIGSYLSQHWLMGLYGITAIIIFAVAVNVALAGVRTWDQKSVLSFSLVSKDADHVVVEISAVSTTGSYRITARSSSPHARHYLSSPISLSADGTGQAADETVPVNVSGPWTIDLTDGSGSKDLRELIVDVG